MAYNTLAYISVEMRGVGQAVQDLRAVDRVIADEHLRHIWPLQHHHIVPNGVYFVNRIMPAFSLPEPVEA